MVQHAREEGEALSWDGRGILGQTYGKATEKAQPIGSSQSLVIGQSQLQSLAQQPISTLFEPIASGRVSHTLTQPPQHSRNIPAPLIAHRKTMAARPVEEVLRIEDLAVSQNDSDDPAREDALLKELDGVRKLNQVMEGVITAMTKARDNMDVHTPLFQARVINKADFRRWERRSRMQIAC